MKLKRQVVARFPDPDRPRAAGWLYRTWVTLTLRVIAGRVEGGDIDVVTRRARLRGDRLDRAGLVRFADLATMTLGVDVRSPVYDMLSVAEGGG